MIAAESSFSTNQWQDQAKRVAFGIRQRALEFTIKNNGAYLSQACSSAEIFATLYTHLMNLGPSIAPMIPLPFPGVPSKHNSNYFTGVGYNGPKKPFLDRFFLSCVQYALVLYTTLVEVGRMSSQGLDMFNQDGSTVEMIGAEHSPGHEITSGSLGQGLSQAAGIALARRLKNEPGHHWVFMSDGEFQSGQTWETIQAMVFHKIGNITTFVDVNGQQCDGPMNKIMEIEPLIDRINAFGAQVVKINGHDLEHLANAAKLRTREKPLFILAYTNTSQGMETILDNRKPFLHYIRLKSDDERRLFQQFKENFYTT